MLLRAELRAKFTNHIWFKPLWNSAFEGSRALRLKGRWSITNAQNSYGIKHFKAFESCAKSEVDQSNMCQTVMESSIRRVLSAALEARLIDQICAKQLWNKAVQGFWELCLERSWPVNYVSNRYGITHLKALERCAWSDTDQSNLHKTVME